jgi:hypothetical protein
LHDELTGLPDFGHVSEKPGLDGLEACIQDGIVLPDITGEVGVDAFVGNRVEQFVTYRGNRLPGLAGRGIDLERVLVELQGLRLEFADVMVQPRTDVKQAEQDRQEPHPDDEDDGAV